MKKKFKTWTRSIGFGFDLVVAENKSIEFEIEVLHLEPAVNLTANWFTKTDNAGPEFYLNVFGNWISLKLYDHRHWNQKENRWYHPNEELKELLAEGRISTEEYSQYVTWDDFRSKL